MQLMQGVNMSNQDKKIVGIGHNSGNTVSKEAYEKLATTHLAILHKVKDVLYDVRILFDEAFTGERYGGHYGSNKKVPTHEKHEKRIEANKLASKSQNEIDLLQAEMIAKARAMSLESVIEKFDTSDGESNS